MPRVILAPRARRWLRAELSYLAEVRPSAVRRRLLSEYPRIGSRLAQLGTRRLVIPPYILIYREKGGDIEIADSRHSRQAARSVPEES